MDTLIELRDALEDTYPVKVTILDGRNMELYRLVDTRDDMPLSPAMRVDVTLRGGEIVGTTVNYGGRDFASVRSARVDIVAGFIVWALSLGAPSVRL